MAPLKRAPAGRQTLDHRLQAQRAVHVPLGQAIAGVSDPVVLGLRGDLGKIIELSAAAKAGGSQRDARSVGTRSADAQAAGVEVRVKPHDAVGCAQPASRSSLDVEARAGVALGLGDVSCAKRSVHLARTGQGP